MGATGDVSSEAVGNVQAVITLLEFGFDFVDSLNPDHNVSGSIAEFSPQSRYVKANASQLHKYGHGTFCRFRIAVPHPLRHKPGVYALVVEGSIGYVGETMDLNTRFNSGYGNISPRNCYVGGRMTNCRINQRVLDESRSGRRVDLYFHATPQRQTVEKRLITSCSPPWNGQGKPGMALH